MSAVPGVGVPRRIDTLLVANRGEIARRIFRTARAMGMRTVAVYSEPDAGSPHVLDADVAVPLGGARSVESYLSVERVLDAARVSGADAIHPGYGFLSENAAFAEACATAGLVFVGPHPRSIRDMGLKDRAKAIAREAGVPVLPDAAVDGDDPAGWLRAAEPVGYPLLVKATAGGGGKGMRLVRAADGLADAVAAARREAWSAFGDGTVFLERYLDRPRHIEVQVFGDSHGNAVHLLERECSIQRRHQKIVEESPSPALTDEVRERMGGTALNLVRRLSYVGAGTVEFLYDDGSFWFLEMNTRLQVEHPVTEAVTGLDLVRMQLDVAMGRPLAVTQDDIAPVGHAIEVRLYAEDPARGFQPTPGRIHRLGFPGGPGIRLEVGAPASGEVSSFYDPMIAKVVAHAPHRDEAARMLARELGGAEILGLTTNRDLLVAILRDSDFLAGETRTDFVDRHPELLTSTPDAATSLAHLAAALAVTVAHRRHTSALPWARPGWRATAGSVSRADWESGGVTRSVGYRLGAVDGDTTLALTVDGTNHDIALRDLGPGSVRVVDAGVDRTCRVVTAADDTVWVHDGQTQTGWRRRPRLPDPERLSHPAGPVAEVPGTVTAVRVSPGEVVTAGQVLVILEAMKMEYELRAAAAGTVDRVLVTVGQYIEANAPLVTMAGSPE